MDEPEDHLEDFKAFGFWPLKWKFYNGPDIIEWPVIRWADDVKKVQLRGSHHTPPTYALD